LLGATQAAAARSFQTNARALAALVLLVAILCFVAVGVVRAHQSTDPAPNAYQLAAWVTVSFVFGAVSIAAASRAATSISIRATSHVLDTLHMGPAASLAAGMRSSSAASLLTAAIALLGLGILSLLAYGASGGFLEPSNPLAPRAMVLLVACYALGAAFGSLLMTLLGSVFAACALLTATAPRTAHQYGSDCSHATTPSARLAHHLDYGNNRVADTLASAALGIVSSAIVLTSVSQANPSKLHGCAGLALLPLLTLAFGIASSCVALLVFRTDGTEPSAAAVERGLFVALSLSGASFVGLCRWLLGPHWLGPAIASQCGLFGVLLLLLLSPRRARNANPTDGNRALVVLRCFAAALEHASLVGLVVLLTCGGGYWFGRSSELHQGGPLGVALAALGLLAPASYVVGSGGFATIMLAVLRHQTDPSTPRTPAGQRPERTLETVQHADRAHVVARDYGAALSTATVLVAVLAYVSVSTTYPPGQAAAAWSELRATSIVLGASLGALVVAGLCGAVLRAVARCAHGLAPQHGVAAAELAQHHGTAVHQEDFLHRLLQDASRHGVPIVLLAASGPAVLWAILRLWTSPEGVTIPMEAVVGVVTGAAIVGGLMGVALAGAEGEWNSAASSLALNAPQGKSAVDDAPKRANNRDHGAAVAGDTLGTLLRMAAGPCLHALVKMLAAVAVALAPLF
jgi:Na+/H+-translocating membrane pyrophosphatase